jgi:hypothetical protein
MEEEFETKRYVIDRNFMKESECKIMSQALIFKMLNNPNDGDPQVPGSYCEYSNEICESLLSHQKKRMEFITGLDLIPTYSYMRIYKKGDKLEKHIDRQSCEISATVNLFSKKITDEWPIWFKNQKTSYSAPVILYSGHAAIYRGKELEHWREPFVCDEDNFQVQVFLHYIDANGPYAETWKYDQRPCIGIKRENIR